MIEEKNDIDTFADRDREPGTLVPLSRKRKGVKRYSLADAVGDLERITRRPIYSTPFPSVNKAMGLGGLVSGYVHVLAGGTGKGKTTLLLDFARHHARHHGPVLFFTLEMEPGHLVARGVAEDLGVTTNDLLLGNRTVTLDEVTSLSLPPRIEYVDRCDLLQLRGTVEDVVADYGQAPLVIVDYLQELAEDEMESMERPDLRIATTRTSKALRRMAKEFGCPLLVTSAVSRGSQSRGRAGENGRRPDPRQSPPDSYEDVSKESGSIEYNAAALLVLHVSDELDCDGFQVATITVAKSRFGRRCHIAAAFDGERGRWHDRDIVDTRKLKEAEPDASQLTAERLAQLVALERDVLKRLALEPLSLDGLRKALKKGRPDIEVVVKRLLRSGDVLRTGTTKSTKYRLAEGDLPGIAEVQS